MLDWLICDVQVGSANAAEGKALAGRRNERERSGSAEVALISVFDTPAAEKADSGRPPSTFGPGVSFNHPSLWPSSRNVHATC